MFENCGDIQMPVFGAAAQDGDETVAQAQRIENSDSDSDDLEECDFCCFDNSKGVAICCDACSKWYHRACMNVSEAQAEYLKTFTCQTCKSAKRNRKRKCADVTET